jgi:hypothetical protein
MWRCASRWKARFGGRGVHGAVAEHGGAFAPPEGYWARIREICDQYGVLLVSDEVICAFGRLGHMFGSDRYGYQPDMITFAKGVTSGYAPLGGVLVSDRVSEPFLDDPNLFLHGQTFGAHPVCCAVANANLDILEREDLCGNVLAHEDRFTELLDGLRDIPLVGTSVATATSGPSSWSAIRARRPGFTADESEWLLRGHLSPRLYEAGLICRADDRAEPVITLSPPLIAGRGRSCRSSADTLAIRAVGRRRRVRGAAGLGPAMRRSIDDYPFNESDLPEGADDAMLVSWAVGISDDYDDTEPRVVMTVEEVGRAGEGLVAHFNPDHARRLRVALRDALREIGEDPGI